MLNWILTWNEDCVTYEADPRHAEVATDELGLKDTKGVVSLCATHANIQCRFVYQYGSSDPGEAGGRRGLGEATLQLQVTLSHWHMHTYMYILKFIYIYMHTLHAHWCSESLVLVYPPHTVEQAGVKPES